MDPAIQQTPALSTTKDVNRHFNTDHLKENLKAQSISGGVATLGAQLIKLFLQIGSTVALARLLTPQDFGLIAMVAVFTGFAGLFKDLGLSMSTVYHDEINHAQVSTLFWINVGSSLLLSLIGIFLAPFIAWIYQEPRLIGITITLSATVILGGLATQHTALLRRQMRFQVLAAIDIATMATGVGVAIILAFFRWEYWSLVGMFVTQSILGAVLPWLFSGWIPGMPRRNSGVRVMLSFGSYFASANMLNYLARNIDNMLIGWYWGAEPLGIYSRAYSLLLLPLRQINSPIGSVAIPALSRLKHDRKAHRNWYLRGLKTSTLLSAPLIAIMAACSEQVIWLSLGRQWKEAAPIFHILAFVALIQQIIQTINWLLLSLGHSNRFFRWSVFSTILTVISIIVGLPFGIIGIAISYVSTWALFLLPYSARFLIRETGISVKDIIQQLWPSGVACVGGYVVATLGVRVAHNLENAYQSIIGIASGMIGLILVATVVPRFRHDVRDLLSAINMIRGSKSAQGAVD